MPVHRPALVLIAALAENRVIGRANRLPWHLPADLKHFKTLTMGRPMLMGRRTWESLPGLLPGRPHLVMTRDPGYKAQGCAVVHSLEQALDVARAAPELMVIGGEALYAQTLPLATRMELTLVHARVEGDALFPEYRPEDWRVTGRESHPADGVHRWAFTFLTLERAA
jgi:dihydrofolate reductase